MTMLSQNFSVKELECRCGCGYGTKDNDVDPMLISKLQLARDAYKKPIKILSGLRCEFHNIQNVGGSPSSSHCKGKAVDIAVANKQEMLIMVRKLIPFFSRMGIYKDESFIHVDVDDKDKTSPVLW